MPDATPGDPQPSPAPAGGHLPPVTTGTLSPPQRAIRLGWTMAEMYHDPPPAADTPPTDLPDRLPGASELRPYRQGQATVASIKHDVDALVGALGLELTSADDVDKLVAGGIDKDTTKELLLAVYEDLLVQLPSVDLASAHGLSLGRMLAVTVIMTEVADPASMNALFAHYRLGNAYGWLDELHTTLPVHAADAVTGSLRAWEAWVAKCAGVVTEDQTHVKRLLGDQGRLWKSLLCGDKLALDLLRPDDYRRAGNRVSRKFLGLVLGYVGRWWPVLLAIAVVAGILIGAILHFASSSAATIIGLVAAAAGSLGITWKTLGATLGKVLKKAEDPLWDTEVREAIIVAATLTPDRHSPRRVKGQSSEAARAPAA